jgi:hypothetical protein
LALVLAGALAAGGIALRLNRALQGAEARLAETRATVDLLKKREVEANRLDTAPKKDEWLLTNVAALRLGQVTRPKGQKEIQRYLWDNSYTPRKGHTYDVALVEWRLSGRTRKVSGEELAEVLWVASVMNSSRDIGYDMTLELEFLDPRDFRIARDTGRGYIFPMESDDLGLPHMTKVRGSIWVPLKLAREIKSVTGVWRATPRY